MTITTIVKIITIIITIIIINCQCLRWMFKSRIPRTTKYQPNGRRVSVWLLKRWLEILRTKTWKEEHHDDNGNRMPRSISWWPHNWISEYKNRKSIHLKILKKKVVEMNLTAKVGLKSWLFHFFRVYWTRILVYSN